MDFFKQYSNGLRLVACKQDNIYTVSLGVFVDVGCVKEDATTNGYSHFIEHLLFKGTKKRTARQINEEIDSIGADLNAFTSRDSTCFYTKSLADDLEKCVDILSDMYFNATFPQEEMDKERKVVLEEIKMCNDTPDDVVADLARQAIFKNQSLGQTILGNKHNIDYCDRHSILEFKQKHYIPQNTVISVCGNFDVEQLDKLVEKYFLQQYNGVYLSTEPEPKVNYSTDFLHKFKDVEQCHLQLSFGAFAMSNPSTYAFNLFSTVLGGGGTSRLYQTIREENGLAYSVYCASSSYLNCGVADVYVGLSPDSILPACHLLQDVLTDIVKNGITQKELDSCKVQTVVSHYMAAENNSALMRLYGRTMLKCNKLYNIEERIQNYKSCTLQQVNQVGKQIFSQPFASAYVGPQVESFDAISKIKLN